MIQRITGAIDECFYTYAFDERGNAKTRFATPWWSHILGLPEDSGDAVASWQRAVHPDDAAAHALARRRVRAGQATDVEFRVVGADGAIRWLWVREHPIDGDGGELLADGVMSDISARKAAEGELEQMSRACVGDR